MVHKSCAKITCSFHFNRSYCGVVCIDTGCRSISICKKKGGKNNEHYEFWLLRRKKKKNTEKIMFIKIHIENDGQTYTKCVCMQKMWLIFTKWKLHIHEIIIDLMKITCICFVLVLGRKKKSFSRLCIYEHRRQRRENNVQSGWQREPPTCIA